MVAFHHKTHALVKRSSPRCPQLARPLRIVEGQRLKERLTEGRVVFSPDPERVVALPKFAELGPEFFTPLNFVQHNLQGCEQRFMLAFQIYADKE